ncbi:hypothetical protein [Georgenia sp. SYP-B2076]|nr:hypothetical protein [Georgenia sp. SYP-B2076]
MGHAHGIGLVAAALFRATDALSWTAVSPAPVIAPGERFTAAS